MTISILDLNNSTKNKTTKIIDLYFEKDNINIELYQLNNNLFEVMIEYLNDIDHIDHGTMALNINQVLNIMAKADRISIIECSENNNDDVNDIIPF